MTETQRQAANLVQLARLVDGEARRVLLGLHQAAPQIQSVREAHGLTQLMAEKVIDLRASIEAVEFAISCQESAPQLDADGKLTKASRLELRAWRDARAFVQSAHARLDEICHRARDFKAVPNTDVYLSGKCQNFNPYAS